MNPGYDLIIIGTGAAGTAAAARAARLGAERIALVEGGQLFGTCINVGCIPSKFLLGLSNLHYYRNFGHPGLDIGSSFDPVRAIEEKETVLTKLRRRKEQYLFEVLGIELVRGIARFISSREIVVDGRHMASDRFVIATGSSPSIPPIEGLPLVPYMTSVEGLEQRNVPRSLIVIGGRAIGLEFAQLFRHLGSDVTLLQRSTRILPEEEPEISRILTLALKSEGIRIETGVEIQSVGRHDSGVKVSTHVQGEPHTFRADRILLATGRSPNTRQLDLEKAGITTGRKGEIIVDATMKTSSPHVWAAGDVLGEPQLEPVASMGGAIAAENAVTGAGKTFDPAGAPHAVFTFPQVASVGLTEARAIGEGFAPVCRSTSLANLGISTIHGGIPGVIKMVADEKGEKVIGVHICAPLAAEMIHEGICAVQFGITIDELIEMLHVFPTYTGTLQVCARAFRKDMPDKEAVN